MAVDVSVSFDFKATQIRIERAAEIAQFAVAEQALKDCNIYVKKDQGILEASSIKASKLEDGMLIWDTPYAKKQYYTGRPGKDTNPNASKLWAHKAESIHGNAWRATVQHLINKEV